MKFFFVVALICIIHSAYSANYYFSATSGVDARTELEAQDPATPWKTLAKLNAFFISLKPGDSVLLKRGETFYGSIFVKQSGSATAPIVIGAYGSGNKPVITSLVTLTGWVSLGNGIWESAADASLGATVNMVLLNGVEQAMGRYPNSDADNKGYLNFESHVDKTSITDSDLNTSINWKGAELVVRPRHWYLDRSLITAQAGTTISYSTSSPYEPYENYGYFIQNSPKTLDKEGEWYYNPATKKISAYFGVYGPSAYVMSAASETGDLVSSVKRSNIVFDNLLIEGSNNSGFNIQDGSNISIQNCDILFSGINGIFAAGHLNLAIENCTIANSNNNAIDLPYGVNNAVIKNNKIINTALNAGMLQNGEGNGLAIYSNGNGNTIESNEIRKTGFIGITFYGNDVTIKNNFIDSFCFVKDDGGGIYTHGGLTASANRSIIGNIITNGVGAGPGTDHFDKRSVTGIYMDANTTDVDISDNTVTTCNQGILIQSTTRINIKHNTIFDNTKQMVMIGDKDNDPVTETVMTQNIFFSKTRDQWALYILSSADDIRFFGRFDSNYYARPIDDKITVSTNYVGANGTVAQNFDLAGWQMAYGQDAHSKKTAKQIMPYNIDSLIGDNKFIKGGDFATDIKGISANLCDILWSDSGRLDGGYLQVIPNSRGSSVYLKVGDVSPDKHYLLSYSARGSVAQAMSMATSLKQSAPPYMSITQAQNNKIDTMRRENEVIFSPSAAAPSAVVICKVDNQSEYYLDNIKFYEADTKITNPDDSIRFEYNATSLAKTVSLQGNYIDTRGRVYGNSIVLQPYTSAILIVTNAVVKNIAPGISLTSSVNSAVVAPFSSITFSAFASDEDGSISKVEFYNDTTLIKTEYKATYDCTMDSLSPGIYTITAKAIDDKGLATTSSPIVFTVYPVNTSPIVSIAISTTASFTAPATIELFANATDANGTISKVEFFNGSTLLTTEYKYPYTYTWQNVAAGDYSITAKATDNDGLSTTSVAFVSVNAQVASRRSSSATPAAMSNALPGVAAISSAAGESGTALPQSDLTKLTAIRLWPNPAANTIQLYFAGIQINQKATLTIYSLSGSLVKKYPVIISGNNIRADISSLLPGVYMFDLSGNNFTINKRFVKVK